MYSKYTEFAIFGFLEYLCGGSLLVCGIFIILIIIFIIAIIYFIFKRADKKPDTVYHQAYYPYTQQQYQQPYQQPPQTQTLQQICPTCSKPLVFVSQSNRWYCNNCQQYK